MKKKHAAILVLLIVLDQLSKILVDSKLMLGQSITILDDFFHITYAHNTGAAWSMFEGKTMFFCIIAVIALVVMFYFYRNMKPEEKLVRWGIILMMAGTAGNLIDRVVYQYVRDFFDFIIFGYDFPIFNLADTALCLGVGLIILDVALEYFESIGARKHHE